MCQVSGCTEPIRVITRQLCQSHYLRWYRYGDPNCGPTETVNCLSCGAVTAKAKTGPRRSYCTVNCRRQAENARRRALPRPPSTKQIVNRSCGHCETSFIGSVRQLYCGRACSSAAQRARETRTCTEPECRAATRARGLCVMHYNRSRRASGEDQSRYVWTDKRRDAYHRRRAQKKTTANHRPVLLSEIRVRDGNRCHLCRKKVSAKPYPHPLSASLDHIVPLSLDGEHVPENVRLAHLRCNVAKGNGGGNEQLLLIG